MASGRQRGDSESPQSRPTDSEKSPEATVGAHMLDQILSLTAGGAPGAEFVETDDLRALREVSRKYAGQPFSLDPVAMAMIEAVLRVQFEKAKIPAATVRTMAEYIATTLYDDPVCRPRMEALWHNLSQK